MNSIHSIFDVSVPLHRTNVAGFLVLGFVLWYLCRLGYNVYLHPLSKFPGPWLAGATRWYEGYYDNCVGPGGQYMYQIDRLHCKYVFGTVKHDLHRSRRAALNPYFSKRSVTRWESVIKDKVARLSNAFRASKQQNNVIDLRDALTATAVDITTEFSFGRCANTLDEPDFAPEWDQMMRGISETVLLARQFPGIVQVAQALPIGIVRLLNPLVARFSEFERLVRVQITEIFARYHANADEFSSTKPTLSGAQSTSIFHSILTSSLPKDEKTITRLTQEALSVISAASETTSSVLSRTIFHILSSPSINTRLVQELQNATRANAGPNTEDDTLGWQMLESLPYLTAVIKEGLRVSVPVCGRLALVAPDQDLQYGKWTIPRGTYISMSPGDALLHDTIYPEPKVFRPERWVECDEKQLRKMERAFLPFNRGPRMCIGLK
ncbi:MAG: hypothetical protein Q9222_006024 [Ikaeria aurantiellina]